jgi:hypothetical protein
MLTLAGSCFPNCHPAGQHASAFQESGNIALAAAFVCVIMLIVLAVRGK